MSEKLAVATINLIGINKYFKNKLLIVSVIVHIPSFLNKNYNLIAIQNSELFIRYIRKKGVIIYFLFY